MGYGILREISKVIPKRIKRYILNSYSFYPYANISYSQEGEDLIIDRLINSQKNGFYVDIGAHHPFRFSNTFKFYLRGWNGLNIDASPGSMNAFHEARKRDINLEIAIGVGEDEELMDYYLFDEPALNTLSKEVATRKTKLYNYKVNHTIKIKTYNINWVLENYLPTVTEIDFLTIDVEGLDEMILKTLNFNKFRPKIILFEKPQYSLAPENEMHHFLEERGYYFAAKTLNTVFYKLCTIKNE
jgi:hypothetical protein